jgi:hypothetical protein
MHLDLDLGGVLRVPFGNQRQATTHADTFAFGKLAHLVPSRQVRVIPTPRTGPIGLLATLPLGGGWFVRILQMVRAVPRGLLFRFATEELILQPAGLGPQALILLLQNREAFQGLGVHTLPIAGLLPQFEVLPMHVRHLGTQLRHFLTQLHDQSSEIRFRYQRPRQFQKHAFHDGSISNRQCRMGLCQFPTPMPRKPWFIPPSANEYSPG